MSPAAVRTRIGADVRRRRAHAQPLLRKRVLDRESERERIPGLRMENVLQNDAVRLALGDGPGRPAHEAMDRVAVVRLGEGEPVTLSVELVGAVLEPVRPRDQHLAPPGRAHLVEARSRRGRRGPPTEYVRSPPPTSTTTASWAPSAISNCSPDGEIAARPVILWGAAKPGLGRRPATTKDHMPIATATHAANA